AMIIYLPAVLSALSLLVAYGSAGRRRQAATIGAVIATGWSLVVLVDVNSGSWAIGPIVATLLLPRPGQRVNSSFEGLTRRVTAGLAGAMALMPVAGEGWRLPGRFRSPVSLLLLGLAALVALLALVGLPIARIFLFDLSLNSSGIVLLAIAVLLVAGAAVTPM